jgi:hypothetical protein
MKVIVETCVSRIRTEIEITDPTMTLNDVEEAIDAESDYLDFDFLKEGGEVRLGSRVVGVVSEVGFDIMEQNSSLEE